MKPMVILLTVCLIWSGGQAYQLQSYVLSGGGNTHIYSSGYRCGLCAGQTAASGLLSSSSYRAVIGFWCRPYALGGIWESEPAFENWGRLALDRCQPNPFSVRAELSYILPVSGHVRLSVLDQTGRVVERLVNGYQAAGRYRVVWDVAQSTRRQLPAGVYLLKLEAQGQIASRSVVIAR